MSLPISIFSAVPSPSHSMLSLPHPWGGKGSHRGPLQMGSVLPWNLTSLPRPGQQYLQRMSLEVNIVQVAEVKTACFPVPCWWVWQRWRLSICWMPLKWPFLHEAKHLHTLPMHTPTTIRTGPGTRATAPRTTLVWWWQRVHGQQQQCWVMAATLLPWTTSPRAQGAMEGGSYR